MRILKQTLTLSWKTIALAIAALGVALMPVVALVPNYASAQPQQADDIECPEGFRCGETNVAALFKTIAEWALGVAFILAVVFLIYGGFRYILAGGNEDSAKQGRTAIFNALIGIVIIVLSFIVVQIVYNFVAGGNGGGGIFGG